MSNKDIIKSLKNQPAYLLVFSICSLSSLTGLGYTVAGIIKQDWIYLMYSLIFLLISLIAAIVVIRTIEKTEKRKIEIISKENTNNIDISYYGNQNEVVELIKKDIENSQEICIFTMRGHSWLLPEREFGYVPNLIDKKVKYCVSDPKEKNNPNKFIIQRAQEYKNTTPKSYWNDIYNDINKVKAIMKINPNFQCKLHMEPAVFRIFIFNDNIYFSFFKAYVSGSQLPVYSAKKESEIYKGFKRFFDIMWYESKPVN